jgi:hypothetical protein
MYVHILVENSIIIRAQNTKRHGAIEKKCVMGLECKLEEFRKLMGFSDVCLSLVSF